MIRSMTRNTRTVILKMMVAGQKATLVVSRRTLDQVSNSEGIGYAIKSSERLLVQTAAEELFHVVDYDHKISLRIINQSDAGEVEFSVVSGRDDTHLVPLHDEHTIVVQNGRIELLSAPQFRRRHAPYTLYA